VKKSAGRELRISGVAVDVDVLVVRGANRPRSTRCSRSTAPGRAKPGTPLPSFRWERPRAPGLLDALRSVASVEEGLAQVSVVGTGIGASKDPLDRALRALGVEPRGVLVAPLRIAFLVPRETAKRMRAPAARRVVERS